MRNKKPHFNSFKKNPNSNIVSSSKSSDINFLKNHRIVTGNHAINECIIKNAKLIKSAWVQKDKINQSEIKEQIQNLNKLKVTLLEKSDQEISKIAASHQGLILFSEPIPEFNLEQSNRGVSSLVLALDGVEDAHNLGAVIRTSWLMGVSGILIPSDRAVGLTSTVHKVACGGVEHVPLKQVNQFHDQLSELKEVGFWVYGLSHKAKKTIFDIDYPDKTVFVLGAEDKGLRVNTEKNCDELVSIPQISPSASYNVSVANGIILSEWSRQRKYKKQTK